MGTRVNAEIGIRDMTDADLVSVVEIVNREIVESPYVWGEIPVTVGTRREWLSRHRELGQPAIVATDPIDDRVLGWASLSTFRPASGYRFTAEVSVYVAAEARGRGIATAMLDQLEQAAREREMRSLIAVIDCGNEPSLRLFRRLGFDEAGRLNDIGRKFGEWRSEVFLIKPLMR